MENVIGGKLKLKKPLEGAIKKKKKGGGGSKAVADSAVEEPSTIEAEDKRDPRTAYERKWEEQVKRLESKSAKKLAEKSHRDRISEFNEKMSKLSEHHDIPRVAGGG
eukprot:CAMPEP_0172157672 /NCGR_PEP_ID=MMETSP1050-20130122/3926_1 /TAXON_ID=233186 /ORGANISM="Cryptomonas curvata, Strain CCAP979/52" /LENGTH=106 /DNA_ID=CAMNT_0012826937 /DNA_START=6 /DNA_END=326 /DNA_ORIENTATION=+